MPSIKNIIGERIIKINKTIETEEGTIQFEGELSQEEVNFVIETGLNALLQAGALPFTYAEDPAQIPLDFSNNEH